jgi:hypothetical protein
VLRKIRSDTKVLELEQYGQQLDELEKKIEEMRVSL